MNQERNKRISTPNVPILLEKLKLRYLSEDYKSINSNEMLIWT